MIKLTNMTANADGTGYLDFTFDNPEDLARLWSLGASGDDTMQVIVSADTDGNWRATGDHLDTGYQKPPIPDDVYYSMGNFYSKATRAGMGMDFTKIWQDRALEFQQGYYTK